MDNLFTFGGIELIDLLQQVKCSVLFIGVFSRIDLDGRLKTCIRKELLRFPAGLSARPVVTPIDFRHRLCPLENCLRIPMMIQSGRRKQQCGSAVSLT